MPNCIGRTLSRCHAGLLFPLAIEPGTSPEDMPENSPPTREPAHLDMVVQAPLLSGLDRFHGHGTSTQLARDDDVCTREFVDRSLVSLEV